MKEKRLLIALASILILFIAGAFGLGSMPSTGSNAKTAFTIDKYNVSDREFEAFLQNNKALTTSYFKRTYNADYGKSFWTSTFNGENPLAYAKQKALDELTKVKVEQIIMMENGIVSDISYEAFLQSYEQENKDRAKKIANNQPIYGPQKYGIAEYYSYYQSMNVQKLIDKWTKEAKSTMSGDELKAYYDKVKQRYFHKGYAFDYEKISIHTEAGKQEQLTKIRQASIEKNIPVDEAAASLGVAVTTEQLTLDLEETSKEDTLSQNLYTRFLDFSTGEYSEIEQSDSEAYMYRLVAKRDKGLEKYEDVKSSVIQLYVKEMLETEVVKRLKETKVQLNKEVFHKITIKT
ncbi:peptidylprolyl isomerase [Paenibacillus sp. FJAT-27812]|uniref:peptidylprolyl isomerase n=1 Tax=Paenibacillus sp. FJAT-27812 TaxID=1684143 RepID=UPI0006A7DA19|nr:peptidylprolyl isomerase [Paenibacillus sp. FJAT-27812]